MAFMELGSGHCLSSTQKLGSPSSGADRLSALPDDLLLLILARIGCFRAAARTDLLARRWRGLSSRLRRIVLRDVVFPWLEAALGSVLAPPPAVSLLEIRVPSKPHRRLREHLRAEAASVSSLLRAAVRLEPEELVVDLSSLPDSIQRSVVNLPRFHRTTSIALHHSCVIHCVPAGVEFPALETLSLRRCTVDLDALLSRCPRLRTLWLLQELVVDTEAKSIDSVDIVAPSLKQLTTSLLAWELSISVLAPMVEEVSWCCRYCAASIAFGLWRTEKLELQMAERQGQLPSLHIYGCISGNFPFSETPTCAQEIQKHMVVAFSVLELHLKTRGHVYGALVFHLLRMNHIPSVMQRLKIVLESSLVKEQCSMDCFCEPMN